mmetsp:Transcript_7904/g.17071  ORF Transcript_7904/g.17071 Transcript_7904/m.17071 type:complete len:119 (-) Transcript_7904:893-1249(-)
MRGRKKEKVNNYVRPMSLLALHQRHRKPISKSAVATTEFDTQSNKTILLNPSSPGVGYSDKLANKIKRDSRIIEIWGVSHALHYPISVAPEVDGSLVRFKSELRPLNCRCCGKGKYLP